MVGAELTITCPLAVTGHIMQATKYLFCRMFVQFLLIIIIINVAFHPQCFFLFSVLQRAEIFRLVLVEFNVCKLLSKYSLQTVKNCLKSIFTHQYGNKILKHIHNSERLHNQAKIKREKTFLIREM